MSTRKRKKPIKYYSPKRRAIYARGDEIDALTLFERDNWTCHLCSRPIDRRRRCPDWWAASIDHVVPLSRGGQHVWSNVKAAHLRCNLLKDDSMVEDSGGTERHLTFTPVQC